MNVKFQIKNRFSGAVLFETELSEKFAEETYAVKLGFAVTEALKARADLFGANPSKADLSKANLSVIKNDLIAEVLRLPNELDALRISIINGKIDGSTYSGKCACLAGTLAKANGQKDYNGDDFEVIQGIIFHSDAGSPREKWFTAIRSGDTPATNPVSKIALEWVDEAIAIRDFIRASAPIGSPAFTPRAASNAPAP